MATYSPFFSIHPREGVTFETLASRLNPRVVRGRVPRELITVWSRRAARQFQRQLPPGLRLPETLLVKMTAGLPAGGGRPPKKVGKSKGNDDNNDLASARLLGGVADPDVDALLRSSQPLRRRYE